MLRDLLTDVQTGLQIGNMTAMLASIRDGSHRLFLMPRDAQVTDFTKPELFALYVAAADRLEKAHEGYNEILFYSGLIRLIIANPEYGVAVDIALAEMNADFQNTPQDPSKRDPPNELVLAKRRKTASASLADFIGAEAYARLGLDTHVHWK